MTRDNFTGFMFGLSAAMAVGYFLKPLAGTDSSAGDHGEASVPIPDKKPAAVREAAKDAETPGQ
jgi:hypothetical protein